MGGGSNEKPVWVQRDGGRTPSTRPRSGPGAEAAPPFYGPGAELGPRRLGRPGRAARPGLGSRARSRHLTRGGRHDQGLKRRRRRGGEHGGRRGRAPPCGLASSPGSPGSVSTATAALPQHRPYSLVHTGPGNARPRPPGERGACREAPFEARSGRWRRPALRGGYGQRRAGR